MGLNRNRLLKYILNASCLVLVFFAFTAKAEAGWVYEDVAFYASTTQQSGLVPVYRFYNRRGTDHFYTPSEAEKNHIINSGSSKWRYEDVAFYASATNRSGYTAVYRFYNRRGTDHFYTPSEVEKNHLTGSSQVSSQSLGPNITVGLLGYAKSYSKGHSMRFYANENYTVKDKNNNVIETVSASTVTKVKYAGSGNLTVYSDGFTHTVDEEVNFDAADGNSSDTIFHVEPKSFDEYRGRFRVKYNDSTDEVWMINIVPLEHYTWGMGEITGTGDMSYNKVMTVVYRTYGYWKIEYSTRHASQGFKVDATSGSQIYYGYDWEEDHPRIRTAAEATRGKIITDNGDVAITPYSSSTDGRTRSWQERWGSTLYPHCQSVPDPYGKVAGAGDIPGNHMVGLSATGALNLADDHNWSYTRILEYYYTGISVTQDY